MTKNLLAVLVDRVRLSGWTGGLHNDVDPLAYVGLENDITLLDGGWVLVEERSAVIVVHTISSVALKRPFVGVASVW